MRQREQELADRGASVLVVSFEAGPMAKTYVEDTKLGWPVVIDEGRSLYRAYGMLRGTWWNVWGPRTWLVCARLLLRGRRVRPSEADPYQLGGDVLIDPDGIVRLHHVGSGPAHRPRVSEILRRVR
ncbi:MAG: redoxin domain-containing protein [Myxococcales bacterium]|nr:redoxin domain-containing protein [Myxococcales bacterium]